MKKISFTLLCLVFAFVAFSQSWSSVSAVPGTRQGAISFVINGKVYVGGGQDSLIRMLNDFYVYDPATNKWDTLANLPDYVGGCACFSHGGKGYVMTGQNSGGYVKSVFEYNADLDKWTTLNSFPGSGRAHPVTFMVGDTGYISGGYPDTKELWAYDFKDSIWTQKTSMTSFARQGGMGFVINNIAYVGLGQYNSSSNYPGDILPYNPATNTWGSPIAQFPGHVRAGGAGFAINGYGYIGLGGYLSGSFKFTNDFYQYNPQNNTWAYAGTFPGQGRGNGTCEQVGDVVYIGCGNNTSFNRDWWRFIYRVEVDLPLDQTVCSGSKVILNPHVDGGIPPLKYLWQSTGDALSCDTCKNPSVTITTNSSYILKVTDANNTTAIDTILYTVSGSNNTLQASLTNTQISCEQPVDTTVATVTGGSSPYTFQWGDGTSITDNSPTRHLYGQAGVYVFSVADSAGCVTSLYDTITNSSVAISLVNAVSPICLEDSSGKIIVSVTGGTKPYTFKWNTGSIIDSIMKITPGDYSLVVTDSNMCEARFMYTLNPANDVWDYYVYLDKTNPNCKSNGSVTVNVYGGVSPFQYDWNTGDSTRIISNLPEGKYTVVVTDSVGCHRRASATIDFKCSSTISGTVFADDNHDCIFDVNEIPEIFTTVAASRNGHYYYGCTDWHGDYSITVPDSGTYYMQTSNWDWDEFCSVISLCGNVNQTVHIDSLGGASAGNNFASSSNTGFDLTIHPGWTTANPGFQKEYWLLPYNQSFHKYTGPATIVFAYDSNLTYTYSMNPIPVHDAVAHTLTWNVDSLPYPIWDWDNFRLRNFFQVPLTLDLGQLLHSDFYIYPTSGDCDSTNNQLHFSETVRGSHDPNEKTVEPAGYTNILDPTLTYTIHFQNTGTDSTYFITVKDTLSSFLEPASVRNVASSHPYSSFNVTENGILTWVFNPLRLVDSISNPAGSQAFVTFTVRKKPNLLAGTVISNKATIYFDYYDGVVTNTVADTVAVFTKIPEAPAQTGVSVKTFPNPFSNYTNIVVEGLKGKFDFDLFDVTGRLKKRMAAIETNQFQLQRADLSSGIYFYRISSTSKQELYGKLVVQ